jgi:hypothetical protein
MINGYRLLMQETSFLLTLVFTKGKGGIHAINRIFMETFGRYRLTGLIHSNICDINSVGPSVKSGGFFIVRVSGE